MCWRRCGGGDIWSPAQILDYLRLHLAPVEMASRKFVSASGAAIVYASISGDLTPKHAAAPIDRKPRGTEIKFCVMPDLPFSLFPCLSTREPPSHVTFVVPSLSIHPEGQRDLAKCCTHTTTTHVACSYTFGIIYQSMPCVTYPL